MPIATPEVYAEMLDRAKAGALNQKQLAEGLNALPQPPIVFGPPPAAPNPKEPAKPNSPTPPKKPMAKK